MTRGNKTNLPLSGTRVLAFEQAVAGPLCTRHLADLGAEVIKIERPGKGDFARSYDTAVHGLSSYFVWLNRGKRSLSLDMKAEASKQIIGKLLAESDVVVHNLAPGAMERLGYGPQTLLERYPRMVICSISGYGAGGPYEERKAFDLLLQGETGVIATTGNGDQMAKLGISVGDIGAGVYGAMGVLAALLERETTGKGGLVESSLFDALSEWMGYPALYTRYGGSPPARAGVRHATVVPYGAYRCGDGNSVLLAVQTEEQWHSFCQNVCQHPEWLADPRFNTTPNRRQYRSDLERMIEESFANATREEINQRLQAADIPFGDLNDIEQFLAHPQLQARDRWRPVETEQGTIESILPPITFPGRELPMSAVPSVGEHTAEILTEIGYDQNEIEALRSAGVI